MGDTIAKITVDGNTKIIAAPNDDAARMVAQKLRDNGYNVELSIVNRLELSTDYYKLLHHAEWLEKLKLADCVQESGCWTVNVPGTGLATDSAVHHFKDYNQAVNFLLGLKIGQKSKFLLEEFTKP